MLYKNTWIIETTKCSIEQLPNGIVRVETKQGIRMTAEDLLENDKIDKEQLKIERALFLVVFGPDGLTNFQSQKKFADPLVVRSDEHNLEANFHANYFKIKYPMKIFSDEREAIGWLLSQKEN